jgi:hypothetical protein
LTGDEGAERIVETSEQKEMVEQGVVELNQVELNQKLEVTKTVDACSNAPPNYDDLDLETRTKFDELLKYHYIFEAYEICPSKVEELGYMKTYRDTVEVLCGKGGQTWEKTLKGDLGDGDQWTLQYCWDGATPGSGGNEYLWVKLGIDQGLEWWKNLSAFHEPDLDKKANPVLADARMVGNPAPTYAIRCNISGVLGKLFGYTQDYIEVRRYINKETGFCIESNTSIDHEELERRGYSVGKKEYKKGNDMLLYVVSFPRSPTKCTAVLYTRMKLFLPGWLASKLINTIGPKLVRSLIPKLIEQQKASPDYQARFAEDKQGIYAYFQDFTKKGLKQTEHREERYSAQNLPPPSVVLGRLAEPNGLKSEDVQLP